MKHIASFFILAVSILVLAGLPGLLDALFFKPPHAPGSLSRHNPPVWKVLQTQARDVYDYLAGVPSGKSFIYKKKISETMNSQVVEPKNFFQEILPSFIDSALYLTIAGVFSLLFGVWAGMRLATAGESVKNFFSFFNTVPDFILALLLQLAVVAIYKATGILIAEVASTSLDTAIVLPLLTLFHLPFLYIVQMVSHQTNRVLREDYILTAKSKGLKKGYIYAQHVLRNVLPFIKGDLFKIYSMMIGNLFIVERLFNLQGITDFLIDHVIEDYNTVVNCFWCLVLLFLLIYGFMLLVMKGLERGFAHE
ncbi:ABC transporter permease subunit [Thermoactinomyces sp. CICC 10522]|uniref:ABC transporter permease subunit n=1 Tax=Thermoactinomyces sp. CICC 10522 TaxID=2767427 RepID=UPI0018DDAD65|nr:ABC transporter permease subunit [Thermoactinomyces sp. CICC 10522]MBH8605933.1 ABC transporter permease subunit [Thermoactinomyces sp. CICC 10522]